jgi:hypothetical protein
MADKIYPEGIRAFSKHDKAPDFVKGTIVITPNDLFAWLKKNENLLTEYEGKKQIKLQILEGQKGLYLQVDTYKKDSVPGYSDSLPF